MPWPADFVLPTKVPPVFFLQVQYLLYFQSMRWTFISNISLLLEYPFHILEVDIAVSIFHFDIAHPFSLSVMEISVSISHKAVYVSMTIITHIIILYVTAKH